jgi:hypothetical protein
MVSAVHVSMVIHMIELIASVGLIGAALLGLLKVNDKPLDRVDRRLWHYLHH